MQPLSKQDVNKHSLTRCRQIMKCDKTLCPAYYRRDTACWHVPKTLCGHHGESANFRKFEQCLTCPVFKNSAESDPRGWNNVVADEVRQFINKNFNSTEVLKLQNDLHLAERKYQRLFEGSKDLIYIAYKNGNFIDVNNACVDILGYSCKEELLSLDSVKKLYDKITHWELFKRQIDRDGFVKDFEALFRKKNGSRIHCLLSGNAVRNNDGEIIGYQGIAKDITARTDAIRNFYQRHRELWVLNSVAFAMNATHDLDVILMTALEKALKVLNLTSGGIFLIDYDKSTFVLRAKQGLPENAKGQTDQIQLCDELLMGALLRKELFLDPEPIFPVFKAVLKGENNKLTELICFLITAKEKACGFIALDVPKGKDLTTGHDFHLLGSLGNFLGGAIENTQLVETIRRHREELKELTAMLFQSQEMERRRIARELHDEVGQALTGINFTLETIEKVAVKEPDRIHAHILEIKNQINRTYQEMRRLSHHLHPAILSDLGLEPAMDAYLNHISKHSSLQIDFKMVGFRERVDLNIESVLYRLSQEALTNTLKHARATQFKLSIIKSYPNIIFLAQDNGIGFDSARFMGNTHTLGLLSMRERAAMLGGKFTLKTAKEEGVRIRIEIPIKEESADD
ncbi:histidine kinase [Desulfococcaceae bacterium HSG9]|nr:histidine kinase [Desulfococcaceae bacterium HSG9]